MNPHFVVAFYDDRAFVFGRPGFSANRTVFVFFFQLDTIQTEKFFFQQTLKC